MPGEAIPAAGSADESAAAGGVHENCETPGIARLTHLDAAGHAAMVDVSDKPDTRREAVARARVVMQPATLSLILAGGLPKGDVLATARIAGIMAAKRTADLIPLCHPLSLSSVAIALSPAPAGDAIEIEATARTTGPTGVEMEALTAASVAALTLYDMCKAVDRSMVIDGLRVVAKSGGRTLIVEPAAPASAPSGRNPHFRSAKGRLYE